jgi:hypothetical protein
MHVRYFTNGFGLSIHTDTPVNTNEAQYRLLLSELEGVAGAEDVKAGKYYVDIAFSFMFEPKDVIDALLAVFTKVFANATIGEEITPDERMLRSFYQHTLDEEDPFIMLNDKVVEA